MKLQALALSILIYLTGISTASAGLIINFTEGVGSITAALSGTMDLNALGAARTAGRAAFDLFIPISGNVGFTGDANSVVAYDNSGTQWAPFGSGGGTSWDSSEGDSLALFGTALLGLPFGYVSGSSISGSAVYNGATFATAGLTPGSYVTTLTNGNFTDTVTVNVGASAPVPVPATFALFGLGLAGLGISRRKRRIEG